MKILLVLSIFVLIVLPFVPCAAQVPYSEPMIYPGQTQPVGGGDAMTEIGKVYGDANVTIIVARIVQLILAFLGLAAIIIFIIGGFIWMTSAGDEEKLVLAKNILTRGLVGLIIIILSYSFASFVIANVIGVAGGGASGGGERPWNPITGEWRPKGESAVTR